MYVYISLELLKIVINTSSDGQVLLIKNKTSCTLILLLYFILLAMAVCQYGYECIIYEDKDEII